MKCSNCKKGGAKYKISYKKPDGTKVKKNFHYNCIPYYPQFVENIDEIGTVEKVEENEQSKIETA